MKLKAFFFEILPITTFFIIAQYQSIIIAALISSLFSLIVLITFYFFEKRIAKFQIFSITLSGLLSILAFLYNEEIFVKIKPSIYNGLFSIVLLGGLLYKKPMMKQFFGSQFFLTEQTWFLLSLRWGLFFGFLTIANEFIWRNYSTEEWVFVKVFILFPLVGIFMLAQLPLTLRGRIKKD